MGLISVADLAARQVEYADDAQAQAAIEDASAVARACVEPTFDQLETPDTPPLVVAVVCGMVRRVLANPQGLQSETLGDYSWMAAATGGVAALLPTAREKRLLRRAAAAYAKAQDETPPAHGVSGVYQQADLPIPAEDDLGLA